MQWQQIAAVAEPGKENGQSQNEEADRAHVKGCYGHTENRRDATCSTYDRDKQQEKRQGWYDQVQPKRKQTSVSAQNGSVDELRRVRN
jgi:hypothetical protein